MRCPSCQSDNADGSRFCGNCGTPFSLSCLRCGRVNRTGSRFCIAFVHGLAPPSSSPGNLSLTETIARLQKYLPEGITDPMRIVIRKMPAVAVTMGNDLRVEFKKEGLPCCNFLPASTTL